MKKKILVILIVLILQFCIGYVYADIEDNEVIDIKDVIQTSTNAKNEDIQLNSRVGLIYDRASKTILYEKNGNKQVKMASTPKIMSSVIVMENAKLTDVVTVDKKAASTGGSRLGLKTGDKITVQDLLYGLMLKSGNDAAVALAIHVGGSVEGFAQLMNTKAKSLGLVNTNFVTPHGLDEDNHYTTAYELAYLADYALNISKIKQIVNTKTYTVTINGMPRTISNTNELLGNLSGVYGVKTGFTNGAGRCLVTSCRRNDLDIITVVLGADTKKIRTQDSIKLIEYASKNYKVINIKEKIEKEFEKWKLLNEKRIKINKATTENIKLELEKISYDKIAVQNKDVDNISIDITNLYYLEAPIEKNKIIGTLKVLINNKTIDVINITNKQEINKKNVLDYMIEFMKIIYIDFSV